MTATGILSDGGIKVWVLPAFIICCISEAESARLYIRTSSMVPRKQPLPELAEVPILGLFHWASLSFCDVGMLVVLLLSSTPFMYILMAAPGSYVPTR